MWLSRTDCRLLPDTGTDASNSISEAMRWIVCTMFWSRMKETRLRCKRKIGHGLRGGKGAAKSSANLPHSSRGEDDAGSLRWKKAFSKSNIGQGSSLERGGGREPTGTGVTATRGTTRLWKGGGWLTPCSTRSLNLRKLSHTAPKAIPLDEERGR